MQIQQQAEQHQVAQQQHQQQAERLLVNPKDF
jgi:hypothetical protein